MKPTNGRPAAQRYRVINGEVKKRKSLAKVPLKATQRQQRQKLIQTTLTSQVKQNLATQHEDYLEDDMSPYSDMDESAPKAELEQVDDQKRVLNTLTSTVRPLLQLFSEDSCLPKNQATIISIKTLPPSAPAKPKIVYKDICLSSDGEDAGEGPQPAESNGFVDCPGTIPLQQNRTQPKFNSLSRFVWTPKSTNVFLELWEKHLKDNIRDKRKNTYIHSKMSNEMRVFGPSPREIKTKMDNMSRKFRLEVEKIREGKTTNWRYFNTVQMLLMETHADDFEEIIFENNATESSTYFRTDNCDAGYELNNMPNEDNILNKLSKQQTTFEAEDLVDEQMVEKEETEHPEVQEQAEKKEDHTIPMSMPQKEECQSPLKQEEQSKSGRMMELEEEKLSIEKQKLQVMKHISRDLLSISKSLVELVRNTKK